jgi:peptidase E
MKLFLASEGDHPKTIDKLRGSVEGKLSDINVACIVTASNGISLGSWKKDESINGMSSLFSQFSVVELENYARSDVIQKIKSVDMLWVVEGMAGYLLYWFRRSKLDQLLPTLLDRGLMYVGSSSGSMICSPTLNCSEWFIGEPEPGAKLIPGLGLIDFEIYPHYDESLLPEIKKHWKKGKLALLKDGEVITKINNKITWLGEERWLEI